MSPKSQNRTDNTARAPVFAIALALILFLGYVFYHYGLSCVAGGIGTNHIPPAKANYNQDIPLDFEIAAWGAPQCIPNHLASDFKEVYCHYRVASSAQGSPYHQLTPEVISDKDGRILYRCTIPAILKQSPEQQGPIIIEYYFDFTANGQYNRRNESLKVNEE